MATASNIATAITSSVIEQQRVWDFKNCFHTWDESEPDIGVIVHGIQDRQAAFGMEQNGFSLIRKDLRETVICLNGKQIHLHSVDVKESARHLRRMVKGFFHIEEAEVFADFCLNKLNFRTQL